MKRNPPQLPDGAVLVRKPLHEILAALEAVVERVRLRQATDEHGAHLIYDEPGEGWFSPDTERGHALTFTQVRVLAQGRAFLAADDGIYELRLESDCRHGA